MEDYLNCLNEFFNCYKSLHIYYFLQNFNKLKISSILFKGIPIYGIPFTMRLEPVTKMQ